MNAVLQVGDSQITQDELLPLLIEYQMLPQLLQAIVIDQAIANIECTAEEETRARQQFYQQQQITSDSARQAFLEKSRMTPEQLDALAVRGLKLETFKQATWGNKLESYFLTRKSQLDRVIYSLLRTQDAATAQELYFRIEEGEQTFAELAQEYSNGSESNTGGLIGPVELSVPHPILAKILTMSQPGQLWPPTRIENWFVIVRLEQFLPAQLDERMQQRLLNELFANWLQEQIQQNTSVNLPTTSASSVVS